MINNFCSHIAHPFSTNGNGISKSQKIISIAIGIICGFPFVLPGFLAFFGATYHFKRKKISISQKSLPVNIATHFTKNRTSQSNSSSQHSNSSSSSSTLSDQLQVSKFKEIAEQTDLSLAKNQVHEEGYKWNDYLTWLKEELPDNFSRLFNSSLESKEEVESFLHVMNLKELQKECKKLDKIIIKSASGKLILSKRLLSLCIPFYKNAFSGKFRDASQSKINPPPDIEFKIFRNSLELLFFNKSIKIEGENINEYLTLANFFDSSSLKDYCEEWLIDNLDSIDTLDLIQIDMQHQLSKNFRRNLQERVNKDVQAIIRSNPLF